MLQLFSSLVARLNYETLTADGGQRALEILYETVPDLLILDLAMPQVSGRDVLQYVRDDPRMAATKVMILTARPNMVPEIDSLGVDAWAFKPITPHEFLERVELLMGSG